MPTNHKQTAMRQALVCGYLDAESPTAGKFAASVLAAGYSETSLRVRRAKYKQWIEIERRRRQAQSVENKPPRRSPVSGRLLPAWVPDQSASPSTGSAPAPVVLDERMAEYRAEQDSRTVQVESVNLSSFGHDNVFTKRVPVKFASESYRAKRTNMNGEPSYE
jgi:hypothetical protein